MLSNKVLVKFEEGKPVVTGTFFNRFLVAANMSSPSGKPVVSLKAIVFYLSESYNHRVYPLSFIVLEGSNANPYLSPACVLCDYCLGRAVVFRAEPRVDRSL